LCPLREEEGKQERKNVAFHQCGRRGRRPAEFRHFRRVRCKKGEGGGVRCLKKLEGKKRRRGQNQRRKKKTEKAAERSSGTPAGVKKKSPIASFADVEKVEGLDAAEKMKIPVCVQR